MLTAMPSRSGAAAGVPIAPLDIDRHAHRIEATPTCGGAPTLSSDAVAAGAGDATGSAADAAAANVSKS